MQTSSLSFILVILSAILSVNYGLPHSSPRSSTVANVIEVSTNQDASVRLAYTAFTSATPSEETHTIAAKSTPHPNPSTSDSNDQATLAVGRINSDINDLDSINDADNAGKGGRPVADLTQARADDQADAHSNDKASTAENGFPWWSLMLILLVTVVIIIAIALPFVLYNRRLNKRRSVIKNSKRASEVIVDSWMAASHSSIPPPSSSTSSDSSNDYDVETSCDQKNAASNLGLMTVEDANSRDNILGAEGGCENVI